MDIIGDCVWGCDFVFGTPGDRAIQVEYKDKFLFYRRRGFRELLDQDMRNWYGGWDNYWY